MANLIYCVDDEKVITDIVKFNLEKEQIINSYNEGK